MAGWKTSAALLDCREAPLTWMTSVPSCYWLIEWCALTNVEMSWGACPCLYAFQYSLNLEQPPL
jgi:hypothetical protein